MKNVSVFSLCVLSSTVLLTAAPQASADELYRQDPVFTVGGFSSQDARNPGGLGWFSEVTDNFTVAGAATITQIKFWGGYVSLTNGNTEGFMIRIYEDAGGTVGSLISTQDIVSFTEVPDFTNSLGHRLLTTCNLNTPVALPAAGQYWLSVVAILPRGGTAVEPQWGWVQATAMTPPMCRQMFFGTEIPTNADVSFVVHGSIGGGCGTADFDGDGDVGTDADIEAFFACLSGTCCATCHAGGSDFDGDGDSGTDADIESFFRVLAGGTC